jgi:hypothetical protein
VSQINNFTTIEKQGIAIESLMSESSELTTEIFHTKVVDEDKLNEIRYQLNFVEHQINSLLFSDNLSKFITTLFFDNSCSQLKSQYNYSSSNCANSCPGFTIINPFQIGIALYFHRQNYYISNNLTENYAHSGVFSQQFARIFTNLTESIQQEGVASLQNTFTIVLLLNGFIILIDCCYIFAFVIIYNYFREQFVKIKEILYFFNNKWKVKKANEAIEESEESDTDSVSDEEKTPPSPKSRKRKTTIDKNVRPERSE